MPKKLPILFSVLALSLTGCVAAAIGAAAAGGAGYLYYNGELRAESLASPSELVDAAVDTLHEFGIPIDSSEATAVDGLVLAHTATQKSIRITTEYAGDRASLGIRVDQFGNDPLGDKIFRGIQRRVGADRLRKLEDTDDIEMPEERVEPDEPDELEAPDESGELEDFWDLSEG